MSKSQPKFAPEVDQATIDLYADGCIPLWFKGYPYSTTIQLVESMLKKLKAMSETDDSPTIRDVLGRQVAL